MQTLNNSEDDITLIGERLAELRMNHNMTQEEFAEYMEVSRQAVSKWELDKSLPDVGKLLKMSELYNVSIDYLLKGTEEPSGDAGQIPDDVQSDGECVGAISDDVLRNDECLSEIPDDRLSNDECVDEKNNDIYISHSDEYIDENIDEKSEETPHADKHISEKKGIVISLVLTGILLIGVLALLIGVIKCQVWNGADSSKELVKVKQLHLQYSLADVSACDDEGNAVTRTVLLDTTGVREGDYVYCYTNTEGDRISVNYTAQTIVTIFIISFILLGIWILLFREARRK